jgi:B-box zinc finger
MVKTKNNIQAPEIIKKKIDSRTKKSISNELVKGVKAAFCKNIEVGKLLLMRLNEFKWEIENPPKLLVSTYICPICAYNYENQSRQPICLPCGHTICKICVYSLRHSLLTGCCPFDRKEYFFIEDLLPVNYALLNTQENSFNRICQVHGMQIIGYCSDHSELLCGRCIFAHKTHEYYELDSTQANEIIEIKVQSIVSIESRLNDLLDTWEKYKEFILSTFERINKANTSHIDSLRKAESELILNIKTYTNQLIEDFEFSDNTRIESNINVKEVINCIKYHLEQVKNFQNTFSLMDICDKLSCKTSKNFEIDSPALIKITNLVNELEKTLCYRKIIMKGIR